MNRYLVSLHYQATLTVPVEGNDEGEAYTKAREYAEHADINEFILGTESESRCECIATHIENSTH